MKQWECIVCGWIYDESVGDPDSGIAPGTKFEDIPDDWMCPECGVGKDDFELIEVADSSAFETTHSAPAPSSGSSAPAKTSSTLNGELPIVIIGSGMAGTALVKEIRKLNKTTPIILISRDDGRGYSKPALSTAYTKSVSAVDLCQIDAGSFAATQGISVWTMTEVTSIDPDQQTVEINHGASLCRYSKLVLALGSHCITPPLSGNAVDQVLSINDLMDFARFQDIVANNNAKKVCIIGAGLIGCEYANDLLNGGFEVVCVDPMATCLPNLLPEQGGRAVQSALEAAGASFHFGRTVAQVDSANEGADNSVAVTLDDGTSFNADIVLSAIGVRANTRLASEAGIAVNRGIVTNTLLETSYPDIYALGDCAEVTGHHLVFVAPLVASSKALAKTLCGEETPVHYPAMPVTVKTPACPVVVCPAKYGAVGEWTISSQSGADITALFLDNDGNSIGFALTGSDISKRSELQAQMPNVLE